MGTRRQFSREFKLEAVRLVKERGVSVAQASRDLEVHKNYAISATDGQIGHVEDFYFDDDAWVVRYLVVDAGSWLSSRKVLISPISVQRPNWLERTLPVSISMEQVKTSPNIDTDKPVSRQNEEQYMGYYGYPYFWGGAGRAFGAMTSTRT